MRVAERSSVQRADEQADLPLPPQPSAPTPEPPAVAEESVQRAATDSAVLSAPAETKRIPSPPVTPTPIVSRSVETTMASEDARLDLPLAPALPRMEREQPPAALPTAESAPTADAAQPSSVSAAEVASPSIAPAATAPVIGSMSIQRAIEPIEGASTPSQQTEPSLGPLGVDTPADLPLRPGPMSTAERTINLTAPAESQPARNADSPSVAPLVGLRPLQPTVGLQRSIDTAPGVGQPSSMPFLSTTPPAGATAHRQPFADEAPAHLTGEDRAAPMAPMATAPVASVSAFAVTQTIQRTAVSDTPASFSTRRTSSPPPLVLAQRSWSGPSQSSMPGIRPSATPPRDAPDLPLVFMPTPVQRAHEEASAESPNWPGEATEPVVQGAWTRATPSSTAEAAPAGPTIGAQRAQTPAAPEVDLDALAGKLYDRIRSKLKAELLVDRERAGFLTDLR
jgi:hypothetical protein